MDAYEATKIVLQRIQSLDPENASKIMGLLLIQDHGEKEMIRLAFGPETLLHSVIIKARKELFMQNNSPSSPLTLSSPFSRQNSAASLRFHGGVNLPSPLSIPSQASSFKEDLLSPSVSSTMNSSADPFYGTGEADLVDEFELQDQLSFLNEGSDMFYPQQDLASSPSGVSSYGGDGAAANWGGGGVVNGLHHRRSCSVNDIYLGNSDDPSGGFGWKPCLYFARGYCKNGTSCRFLHGGGLGGEAAMVGSESAVQQVVGSPSKFEMMERSQEVLRSKLMAASNSFPYSSVAADKCMNFLLQQQQLQAESPRGLMMGDEMHKFSRNRFERGDFGINGGPGIVNPVSRQIYLTFPADSTFKEEDVSNYFSMYGPVQDVRIPYQQKRMFGFVTFVFPETVKIILAKGNPHFVCDARVLVKPYKEKGKVPDKHRKQQQLHMEKGEFVVGSPTGSESRDPYDLPLGARMFYSAQDMLWKRKLEEQADLQQAIELQNRRLMGLQLLDIKRNNHHHRTLSTGAVISSPIHSPSFFNHNAAFSKDHSSSDKSEDSSSDSNQEVQQTFNVIKKEKESSSDKRENGNCRESPQKEDDDGLPESLEHNLPDSLFLSPKAAGEYVTAFSNNARGGFEKVSSISAPSSANNNLISSSLFPAATSLDIAPLKSCYFQLPRFAPGHGTVGM